MRVANWVKAGDLGTVTAALLVSTSDVDSPDWPAGPIGFSPMPLMKMPFPTIVVASTNDPMVVEPRSRVFAEAWGAEYHVIGAKGHINADSGLGDWPEGQAWLDELIATVSAGR
jgi:predicted alpha/beta hydrolase family esterase